MQKSANQYNIILSGHTLKRLSPKERELWSQKVDLMWAEDSGSGRLK